jgi:hypothetical protein
MAVCPVCEGERKETLFRPLRREACRWCQQLGEVSERQRDWLKEQRIHLAVASRTADDEVELLEQYREDFNAGEAPDHEDLGGLADGLEQTVRRIDDYEMTAVARAVGLLEAA